MKKRALFTALVMAGVLLQGCEYDDTKVWDSIGNLEEKVETLQNSVSTINTNISTLQELITAMSKAVTIKQVNPIENGYEIIFSNGNRAEILNGTNGINGTNGTNGTNGANGTNAPEISVKEIDGELYWTIGGELLQYNGKNIKASATDAIAPQIRINPNNKEWETSVDGGKTWVSSGVKAEGIAGASGDSFFQRVNTDNADYVTFILHDNTQIKVARYDESAPEFIIDNINNGIQLGLGETITLNVTEKNVDQFSISKPDGWRVSYSNSVLTITAPEKHNTFAEKTGEIAINIVSESNKSVIVKIHVDTYELRILTFEDQDAKFTEYELYYCGATIGTWSDLIAEDQYMSPLIYDMSGSEPYYWYDEGNTELTHAFPYNYNAYAYWGGGHAISNYANRDIETYGDYMSQLTVYGDEGAGGHNGSANFCMHFGYIDGSGYNNTDELSSISFYDGVARVIDHMWVNNSNYSLNCYVNGNDLTANIGENDTVWLTATGYDENDQCVGETIFYLVNGPENIVTEWSKWDLSPLGAVVRVEFNVSGTSDNGYGFSQPAYFAYDDVAVRF